MVCGIPAPDRRKRQFVMLRAYIDDSNIGTPPVYVLAGWMAPVGVWERFSDDWDQILRMSPRIRYFKYAEAMSLNGEFSGMSKELRDEKLCLLVNLMEEYNLTGVASVMPQKIFQDHWGQDSIKEIRTPIYPLVLSLMGRALEYHFGSGSKEKLDFVFDVMPTSGAMQYVYDGWEAFRFTAPSDVRDLMSVSPPSFQSDMEVVALQAADFIAGWIRERFAAELTGKPIPNPPWGDRGRNLATTIRFWDREFAESLYLEMYGHLPVPVSWSYHYGLGINWLPDAYRLVSSLSQIDCHFHPRQVPERSQ